MMTSIPYYTITDPTTSISIRWLTLTEILTPYFSLDPTLQIILANAIAAFYLFKEDKKVEKIIWRYSGKLPTIEISSLSTSKLQINFQPGQFSPEQTPTEIFGSHGEIDFVSQQQVMTDQVFLQNPLQDFAFFVSKNLEIEASAFSLPLFNEENHLTSFIALGLTIPAAQADDHFTQIRTHLESPQFIDELIAHQPNGLVDIGTLTWQILGKNLENPQLLCTQENL